MYLLWCSFYFSAHGNSSLLSVTRDGSHFRAESQKSCTLTSHTPLSYLSGKDFSPPLAQNHLQDASLFVCLCDISVAVRGAVRPFVLPSIHSYVHLFLHPSIHSLVLPFVDVSVNSDSFYIRLLVRRSVWKSLSVAGWKETAHVVWAFAPDLFLAGHALVIGPPSPCSRGWPCRLNK